MVVSVSVYFSYNLRTWINKTWVYDAISSNLSGLSDWYSFKICLYKPVSNSTSSGSISKGMAFSNWKNGNSKTISAIDLCFNRKFSVNTIKYSFNQTAGFVHDTTWQRVLKYNAGLLSLVFQKPALSVSSPCRNNVIQ